MKKVVILVGIIFRVCYCEGMLDSQNCLQCSSFAERNLGALPGYSLLQEQWEAQRERESSLDKLREKILTETNSVKFDRVTLLGDINSTIESIFVELLDKALNGDIDNLEFLSERIYSGRLMNKLIFNSLKELPDRQKIIFEILVELLRKTTYTSVFLKNIKRFCPKQFEQLMGKC